MAGESPQPPAGHEQDGFCGLSQHQNMENHMHMYPLQDFYYNKRPQKQIRELISWWRTIWPRPWVHCSYCLSSYFSNSWTVFCCSKFWHVINWKRHTHTHKGTAFSTCNTSAFFSKTTSWEETGTLYPVLLLRTFCYLGPFPLLRSVATGHSPPFSRVKAVRGSRLRSHVKIKFISLKEWKNLSR